MEKVGRQNINLLDCTLRDGGYYTNWCFSENLVNRYLAAMSLAKIEVVELGFRNLKNQRFRGALAYTKDSFLEELNIPDSISISVMVNASEILSEENLSESLSKLFPNTANSSPIKLIRIASHFKEIDSILDASDWLFEKGYKVGLNLMQIADRTSSEIEEFADKAGERPIDVLYFADSTGSLKQADIKRIVSILKDRCDKEIGVHAHDNLGLALQNTLTALDSGCRWADATLTGMGRGPGNAKMEELIIEIKEHQKRDLNFFPLISLAESYFYPLKLKHGWGTNPYYYLAGKYKIHPSFIQTMQSNNKYTPEDILAVIEFLGQTGGKSFSEATLNEGLKFYQTTSKGSWAPKEVMKGKDVIILSSGPSSFEHKKYIEKYICEKKPLVICLNTKSIIAPEKIDYYIACHPIRLLANAADYSNLLKPLIIPLSNISDKIMNQIGNTITHDYGIGLKNNTFEFHLNHCLIPSPLVLSYALAVATSGECAKILLAGFDGYKLGDSRNDEVENALASYHSAAGSIPCLSVTPSNYKNIDTRSIYGL